MKRQTILMIVAMIAVMALPLFAQDCEEWVGGVRTYIVGETCMLDGQAYECIQDATE